jgi:FlaG/FlaF family flagellin (archaellin)
MHTTERTYSLMIVAALAVAVVVSFAALVHSFSGVKFVW